MSNNPLVNQIRMLSDRDRMAFLIWFSKYRPDAVRGALREWKKQEAEIAQ